jgi:hypothetical protein
MEGYDYLITLPDEIQLIWQTDWTASHVLFLLTRYMTWLDTGLALLRKKAPRPIILEFTPRISDSVAESFLSKHIFGCMCISL